MNSIDSSLSPKNNQTVPVKKTNDSETKRMKIMAQKYLKYCKKSKQNKANQKFRCAIQLVSKIHGSATSIWHNIMPASIRGAISPLERLRARIKRAEKEVLDSIPFSKKSISQSIFSSNSAVVITYSQRSFQQTLQKINNNQQINLLVRSKIQILPIKIDGEDLVEQQIKIRKIISSNMPEEAMHQLALVIRKGLFQQIIILNFLPLENQNLFDQIIKTIEQRDLFQSEIKQIAQQNGQQLDLSQYPISQKLTTITRSSTHCGDQ